ncbi:GTP binding protein 4 [Ramicandelaber brevisporus]|nr:GTP binding protein 4 [Ramicandelaber brevisporus]
MASSASLYNFKRIQVVPTASDFVDIVLSKTQRKTPTVIHKNYAIGRIRQFYMRKVKFAHDSFDEKLRQIIEEFPKMDSIHPFYSDLMNVLYDKDHYKLALSQINTAASLIDSVARDYVRLLKFADSLYRCKQLKKAALGRMATIMKRQKENLGFLENVRQHLARLPSIDPNTRTLIICGYPNVGKSSFLNKVTNADVDVQPYAFTTKSLFVGHMYYKYMSWQVIDTPGILDHPLEERNVIEMQSITALAHLRACVMYFIDLSEQCGYSVAEQCSLYHSIKPLFANKPKMLVLSKLDAARLEDLSESDRALVDQIIGEEGVTVGRMSTHTEDGVMDVRNAACDQLLAMRVEIKMRSAAKMGDVLNKLHVATPAARDDQTRPAFIPEGALKRRKYDPEDPDRPKLERDLERENGGPGVYVPDVRKHYKLDDDDWKYDIVPEIMDAQNIADWVDAEILEKLEALEKEEEQLEAQGYYKAADGVKDEDEEWDSEEEEIKRTANEIRKRKQLLMQKHSLNKGRTVDRKISKRIEAAVEATRPGAGARNRSMSRFNSDSEGEDGNDDDDDDAMELEGMSNRSRKRARSESRAAAARSASGAAKRDRSTMGVRDASQLKQALDIRNMRQRQIKLEGRAGEADRAIQVKMPKHLFSGKRKGGKTDRR